MEATGTVQNAIDETSYSRGGSLAIVVGTNATGLDVKVPSSFTSLQIISVESHDVWLNAGSSFCGIDIAHWNSRSAYTTYSLWLSEGIYVTPPDYDPGTSEPTPPPFQFRETGDLDNAAEHIEKSMVATKVDVNSVDKKTSDSLPWLATAAAAGTVSGTAAATAFVITKVQASAMGCYISYGPLVVHPWSASLTGSLAMGAGAVATGAITGAAVAAMVYYVPWSKIGNWLMKSFNHFLTFMKSVWDWLGGMLKRVLSAILTAVRAALDLVNCVSSLLFQAITGGRFDTPAVLKW